MIDYLPSDEIYDHDSEEKERADREIEALERDEFFERQVDDETEKRNMKKMADYWDKVFIGLLHGNHKG